MPFLAAVGLGLAAAQTGVSVAGAAGAFGGASGTGTTTTKIPLSPRARALQNILSRSLVQNLGSVSPSFGEYTDSGGKALFPFMYNITPREGQQLGLYTKTGKQIPFVDPKGKELTPEQVLFLAQQQAATVGATGPLVSLGKIQNKIEFRTLRDRPTEKLIEKRNKLVSQLPRVGHNRKDIFTREELLDYVNGQEIRGEKARDPYIRPPGGAF